MFSRKLQVKFQGIKIQQKQNYLKRYCFYYVHKTWLNGILVLNESSNILITSSENLREIAPFDRFKNIGMNINWCWPLFSILSKIAPKILKLSGIKNHRMNFFIYTLPSIRLIHI